MQSWTHENAAKALSAIDPHGFNREIADYWLSLWQSDTPPTRASFDPMKIVSHLSAVAIFEVRPGETVRCRLAGNHYRLALGFELTGLDLLALTPFAQRGERMRNATEIVRGAISIAQRAVLRADGSAPLFEEVVLPFADCAEDGSHRYLVHSNWRPGRDEWGVGPHRADTSLADQRRYVPIG